MVKVLVEGYRAGHGRGERWVGVSGRADQRTGASPTAKGDAVASKIQVPRGGSAIARPHRDKPKAS